MVCDHVRPVEQACLDAGLVEDLRGQIWTMNCREWVYYPCVLDTESLRERLGLPDFVESHSHRGTHEGSEAGLVCTRCHDAVMGAHPDLARGALVVR